MHESHRESAERFRSQISRVRRDTASFREALLRVPPTERDAWLDCAFGLGELPDDGADLPSGCVPYVPCSVDALLRVVDQAPVRASDVFVDVGSGLGRAAALVHLLTGAAVIGIEIQAGLVVGARDLVARLQAGRISCVEGDAVRLTGWLNIGSVFFLYCPFSGERLAKVVAALEPIARTRMIRVCCVDLPPLACPWLTVVEAGPAADLAIYRSTLHDERLGVERR